MFLGDQAQLRRRRLERHLLKSKGTKVKKILLRLAPYEIPFGFLVVFGDAQRNSAS